MMDCGVSPFNRDGDEEDHEAKSALRTLFEAEEIKRSKGSFLSRIADQLEKKLDILSSIRTELPETLDMEEDDAPENGTRRVEDFFKRIAASDAEEQRKTHETPADRRARRAQSAKKIFLLT